MRPEPTDHYAREFVEELMRAGTMLAGLLDNLADSLPDDAYPDEANVEVVLDMIAGTLQPVTAAAGSRFMRQVIALLGEAQDKVITDLRLAMELARVREQMAGHEETQN
jgi:hypothetical protein